MASRQPAASSSTSTSQLALSGTYLRDARGGIGEREAFRTCFAYLADTKPDVAKALISVIPEYGRWDDLWCLIGTSLTPDVLNFVSTQLVKDMHDMEAGKSVSLLAKWMPSCNTSSPETRKLATKFRRHLEVSEKAYRKMLSKLRGYIDVLERKLSDKSGEGWSKVDYEKVPSKANLIYKTAFMKHDAERRKAYIEKLTKGEAKINSAVNFPYDIVHKYCDGSFCYSRRTAPVDSVLEGLWKALPDYIKEAGNVLPVLDGSGSMFGGQLGASKVSAVEIANSLGIYFSERMSGQFKNRAITFSAQPHWLDFNKCSTLKEKLDVCFSNSDCSNTNIKATFDLILQAAVDNKLKQEDLPATVLIISDGEFDGMTDYSEPVTGADAGYGHGYGRYGYGADKHAMFNKIQKEWQANGYQLPRLVFWNVCSRTLTVPVQAKPDLGVILVGGFSPAIAKMVLSQRIDPYSALVDQLNDKRYNMVDEALKGISF